MTSNLQVHTAWLGLTVEQLCGAHGFTREKIPVGSDLCREGKVSGAAWLVLEGTVVSCSAAAEQRVPITAQELRTRLVGIEGCLRGEASTVTVEVSSPCEVLRIESDALWRALAASSELRSKLLAANAGGWYQPVSAADTQTLKLILLGNKAHELMLEVDNHIGQVRAGTDGLRRGFTGLVQLQRRLSENRLSDLERSCLVGVANHFFQVPDLTKSACAEGTALVDTSAVGTDLIKFDELFGTGLRKEELDCVFRIFKGEMLEDVLRFLTLLGETSRAVGHIYSSSEKITSLVSAIKSQIHSDVDFDSVES